MNMTLTDVNIKVPEGMTMYLKPQNQRAELVRNALLLYPYINDNTMEFKKTLGKKRARPLSNN